MANAKARYPTDDRNIVAASRAYCAEMKALEQLCQQYVTVPDNLPDGFLDRITKVKQQALQQRPTTMAGVIALARMIRADGFSEPDLLVNAMTYGLLRVCRAPNKPRLPR